MGSLRTLPLFDEKAQPSSWNERMAVGEYAVHCSRFEGVPSCTVFGSMAEAEAYAKEQIVERTDLRCRIYTHEGFVGRPVRELRGSSYKGESEMSGRFRRWIGSILLFGGIVLVLVDWRADFRLSWPAMIGARMLVPGLILLMTEALLLHTKRKNDRAERGQRYDAFAPADDGGVADGAVVRVGGAQAGAVEGDR